MITWTDIFEGTGAFFLWIFKGMKMLGHGPNLIISICVISAILYWTMRLMRYRKEAQRNSTIE